MTDIYRITPWVSSFSGFTGWQNSDVFKDYESLVWTERYSRYGDFILEMSTEHLSEVTNLLSYNYLMIPESSRLMMVETFEIKEQNDGIPRLIVKGRSFEAFLENRSNMGFDSDPEIISGGGTDYNICQLVRRHCAYGSSNPIPADNIQDFSVSFPLAGTSTETVFDRSDLYSVVVKAAEGDGLGWSITRNSSNQLVFRVLPEIDRSDPASGSYFEYSMDTDRLDNVSTLRSIAKYKTAARVYGPGVIVDVPRTGAGTLEGINRRTLFVDGSNIDPNDTLSPSQKTSALTSLGKQELNKLENRFVSYIDGEVLDDDILVPPGLGEIVMVKDAFGNEAPSRIVEVIHSFDKTGHKKRPTFEILP